MKIEKLPTDDAAELARSYATALSERVSQIDGAQDPDVRALVATAAEVAGALRVFAELIDQRRPTGPLYRSIDQTTDHRPRARGQETET